MPKPKKRCHSILLIVAAAVTATTALSAWHRLRGMGTEYATAQAIRDLGDYVQKHGGRWPASPRDLDDKYPLGGGVYLDYSVTSAQLIARPELLRFAVRPRSGGFHTFPHYEQMIGDLHAVLQKTNNGSKHQSLDTSPPSH